MYNNCHSNLLCGISYRHPNGDLEWFIEYLSSVADKINQENETCIILGNFNLELLKLESHSATVGFLYTLGCHFFQPYYCSQQESWIIPTATFIDNTFFNSIEHLAISGKIVYDLTDHLLNFIIFNKFSTLLIMSKYLKEITQNLISRRNT